MVEDPITFVAGVVIIFSHVWMAIVAREDSRAKGVTALLFFVLSTTRPLVFYSNAKKKKKPDGFTGLDIFGDYLCFYIQGILGTKFQRAFSVTGLQVS